MSTASCLCKNEASTESGVHLKALIVYKCAAVAFVALKRYFQGAQDKFNDDVEDNSVHTR
jgi:hypothetical protein